MSKIIVYETENKNIAIVVATDECGLTVEQVAAKDVPTGTAFTIIDAKNAPSSREHREAWELVGNKIVVNQTKAAAIDAKLAAKVLERQALLSKLGLSESEAQALLG
jgi:hypothetical protein